VHVNQPKLAPIIGPEESHIPFPTLASYPTRTGNIVRPLVDGVPAFRRICEAIEEARHSIWLTVTFFAPEFQMPDGRGSIFDVLDHAVERGLDVRVLFWRPNPESSRYGRTFPGSHADRSLLRARGSRFRARWDRAGEAFCQHQKS
jgi:phosphatidylserine/phosphatidylglycerophosphate/cardiolipin synthase-like enzyme